jgi:hypothetical protein
MASACNKRNTKFDLRGSWYFSNDESDYLEICFGDSSYLSMKDGRHLESKYYLKGDSIFFHVYDDEAMAYNYEALLKIVSFKNDTLRLVAKEQRTTNEFWVRLPKNEIGVCDLDWAATNFDSVEYKAGIDYDKRRVKYFSIKNHTLSKYDSLVRVGYWDWDMKKVKEAKAERIRALEKRLQELEDAQK